MAATTPEKVGNAAEKFECQLLHCNIRSGRMAERKDFGSRRLGTWTGERLADRISDDIYVSVGNQMSLPTYAGPTLETSVLRECGYAKR